MTRDDVYAVAGIREPGLKKRSRSSGVYRFSLHGKRAHVHIRPPDAVVDHAIVGAAGVRRLTVRALVRPEAAARPG